MKLSCFASAAALVAASLVGVAHATTIDGAIFFDGGTTNFYDPANGFVPPGYGNESSPTVTVPGTFGFEDGANLDTAAFTATTLTVTDETSSTALNWTQVFTASQPDFFGGIQLVSDSFVNGGVSYSVMGDTLTITWPGTSSPGTGVADFTFSGGVPEPSTWAMMLIGFAGLGFAGYRASRKATTLAA